MGSVVNARPSGSLRVLLAIAAIAGAAGGPVGFDALGQDAVLGQNAVQGSVPEEIAVELRAGRIARQTVLGVVDGGMVLVPARPLFHLVEIHATVDSVGRLAAVREPLGVEIGVDPVLDRAWVGQISVPKERALMHWSGQELYLGAPLMERLLNVRVEVDLSELTVTLDPADDLPVGRRVARERARNARSETRAPELPDRVVDRQFASWRGATLDWSLSMPDLDDMEATAYGITFGGGVLDGALELRYDGSRSARRMRGSWISAWPEARQVRQLRLGEVSGTGPRPRTVQGVAVTSSPLFRPNSFGQALVGGWVSPGWEVELYRDGELVDFTFTDEHGYYEITTPVDYGSNPVEVRLFGPNGEHRVLSQAIPVGADRLPAGKFEYEASAGGCGSSECEALSNVDLRYGINRSWTVRYGADAFLRSLGGSGLIHPYTSLSGAIRNRLLLRADAVAGALMSADLGYEPTPDLRSSVSHTWFDSSTERPILTPDGQQSRTRGTFLWRPKPRLRSLFLSLDGARTVAEDELLTRVKAGVSSQVRNLRWTAEWREERLATGAAHSSSSIAGVSASTALRARGLPLLSGLFIRGTADVDVRHGAMDRAGVTWGKNLWAIARVELITTWSRDDGGVGLTLGISSTGRAVHSRSQITRAAEGELSSAAFLEGSLLWNDAMGRLQMGPGRSSGRGGVSGIVFLDSNANGWRDPAEEPIPGVRLRVGPQVVEADELGRYSVWDLSPFEATELALDAETLPSPLWVPEVAVASVVVMPNGFREVDLAVTPGAELVGQVFRDAGGQRTGVGGIGLVLKHLVSGRRYEAMSFHDGEFYFLALPPGEYEISVRADVLDLMGLKMAQPSQRFSISASPDSDSAISVAVPLVAAR